MTHLKTALIGAASLACLLTGAAMLAVGAARAEPVIGDSRGWRPDPGYTWRDSEPRPGRDERATWRPGDRDWRGHRHPDRRPGNLGPDGPVFASASVAGDLPADVKVWRAKRRAVEQWQEQVGERFGIDFASWQAAADKQVSCSATAARAVCEISAVPTLEPVRNAGERRWNRNRSY